MREPRKRLLAVIKPPKPASETSEAELDRFAAESTGTAEASDADDSDDDAA